MSKHNYSQYSNKKYDNKVNTTPEATVEIQNGVDIIVAEEVETPVIESVIEPAVEAKVETVTETKSAAVATGVVATGVVANCAKLNVRSNPSTNGDVVAVLNADDKISIDVDKSTEEWFKIRTADGVKGYCMKKFVNANI